MSAGIQQTPVGIFWDLENCPVPRNKSPSDVIAYIRNFFVFNRLNHREYDFVISCDVTRLRKDIPEDINKAGGVTLSHVNGSSKNAADEKLRENMKKFVDTHASYTSPVMILISGDVDFVNDLRGCQMRLGCTVVLIHSENCASHFKVGWNEIYSFKSFCSAVRDNPAANAGANAAGYAKKKQQNSKTPTVEQSQGGQSNVKNLGGQQTNAKTETNPFRMGQPGNSNDKIRRPGHKNTRTQNRTSDVPPSHQPAKVSFKHQGQHVPVPTQNQGQRNPVPRPHQGQQFAVPPPHSGQSLFDTPQYQDQHFAVQEHNGQYRPAPLQHQGQPIPVPRQHSNQHFTAYREHYGQSIPTPLQHQGQPIPVPRQHTDQHSAAYRERFGQSFPTPPQQQGQPIPVPRQHEDQHFAAYREHYGQSIPTPPQYQGQPIPLGPQNKGPQFHQGNKRRPRKNVSNENLLDIQPQLVDISPNTVPDGGKPATNKFILMVGGLPGKTDFKILREQLQSEANKVHGRVMYVKNGQGFITFKNKVNADRAVELFNGIQVFGKTLRVSFTKSIPFEDRTNEKPKSDSDGLEPAKKTEPDGASKPTKADNADKGANNATDIQPLLDIIQPSGSNGTAHLNNDDALAGMEAIINTVANRVAAAKKSHNKGPDSCSIQ